MPSLGALLPFGASKSLGILFGDGFNFTFPHHSAGPSHVHLFLRWATPPNGPGVGVQGGTAPAAAGGGGQDDDNKI